jgi:hypothetical protein
MSRNSWYWSKIDNVADAIEASNLGFWAAVFVAVVTTIFATVTLVLKKDIAGINPLAYIDAVLFAIIAWRIRRRSRAFAVIGLCLFVLEKVVQFSTQPQLVSFALFMAVVITLLFINGVRGTFAFHKLSAKEQQSDPPVIGA